MTLSRTAEPMDAGRFRDGRQTRYTFTDEYLVVCPRCEGQALVRGPGDLRRPREGLQPRFSCTHCGLSRVRELPPPKAPWVGPVVGGPYDGYFGQPLWLQTPCCGHTLWANNAAHLAFLEAFVGAGLRERRPDPEWGWSNQALASRLPRWMQRARNREAVLRGLRQLRDRLQG